jgi:hypothetical protein
MTFLIFALSQNGARRNDVFNCFLFSSANPTFIMLSFSLKIQFQNVDQGRVNFLVSFLKLINCSVSFSRTYSR